MEIAEIGNFSCAGATRGRSNLGGWESGTNNAEEHSRAIAGRLTCFDLVFSGLADDCRLAEA